MANGDVAIKIVRAEPGVDTDTRRRCDRVFLTKGGRLPDALRTSDCFGELLYFEGSRRITTITASSTLTVIEIKVQALQQPLDALWNQDEGPADLAAPESIQRLVSL